MAGDRGRRVEKPWGHELIWAHTDRYVGKIITIDPGKRLSLQYHELKDESLIVLEGTLRLHLEGESGEIELHDLKPGENSRIPVGKKHRFEALTEILRVDVARWLTHTDDPSRSVMLVPAVTVTDCIAGR